MPRIRVLDTIHGVPAPAWDTCAGADNPFVTHAFLATLEDSGSATAATGWQPVHLVGESDSGTVCAVAPLYLKSHSFGEYVFDWGWADAFERAGGRYYPKLQCAVPFSPVTGPRLMVAPGEDETWWRQRLAEAMQDLAVKTEASSVHVTFCTEAESALLSAMGFLHRTDTQYHWEDAGYGDFEGFLHALNSRKRKTIRRERRAAAEHPVTVRPLTGRAVSLGQWRAFDAFYRETSGRKWGQAYLSPAFFPLLGTRLPDSVVLMLAEDATGDPVAGALNLQGTDTLFGRHWGALADYRFLHFEACYYQAIDHALTHGLRRVEAGAQGRAHKLARGYLPSATHSAHWIAHPGLRDAVARYLEQERALVAEDRAQDTAAAPYRRGD